GAWYHVMNRGRRSDRIFQGRNDYLLFIDLLKDVTELWDVRISAYCLMSNHYHMVINTPRGNISRCMRHVDGVYTQRFNRSHGFDGPLFRGRFKSILVHVDSYLLQLVRYIHRNPVRAGVAGDLEQYPWSSHKGYLSPAKKWDWLHKDFVLSMLSGEKRTRLRAYRHFMKEEDSEEISQLFERKKWPAFLGDEKFASWLRGNFFEHKRDPQIPESGELAPELDAIKKEVCSYYGVEQSELLKSRRGRFNEPRSMAIYLARMLRKDSLIDISSAFGLSGYSSASSVLQAIGKQLLKNQRLQERYEILKKALIIGQTET
ncbi:MAG: transposase, partial [Proteobacteria bacterium]|nr:transposase [Pseudomonadota bacterium]